MITDFEYDGFAIGDVVRDIYAGIEGTIDAICVYAHMVPEYRVQIQGKVESYWLAGGRLKHKEPLGLRAISERFVIADEIDNYQQEHHDSSSH